MASQSWFVYCTGCTVKNVICTNKFINYECPKSNCGFPHISKLNQNNSHLIIHSHMSRKYLIQSWISIVQIMSLLFVMWFIEMYTCNWESYLDVDDLNRFLTSAVSFLVHCVHSVVQLAIVYPGRSLLFVMWNKSNQSGWNFGRAMCS